MGSAELAITDHVDFEPGAPAYGFSTFEQRERQVREAAERWAPQGVAIRFGVELTYERASEDDIRAHLRAPRLRLHHRLGPCRRRLPVHAGERRRLGRRPVPRRDRRAVLRRGGGRRAFRPVRHARPHRLREALPRTPCDRRRTWRPPPELLEPILRALVDTGTALEINTSGLRQPPGETYPSPGTVARFRELGGERITIGTDAHRAEHFAFALADGYDFAGAAGFESLWFRRGTERAVVPLGATMPGADPS